MEIYIRIKRWASSAEQTNCLILKEFVSSAIHLSLVGSTFDLRLWIKRTKTLLQPRAMISSLYSWWLHRVNWLLLMNNKTWCNAIKSRLISCFFTYTTQSCIARDLTLNFPYKSVFHFKFFFQLPWNIFEPVVDTHHQHILIVDSLCFIIISCSFKRRDDVISFKFL